MLSPAYLSFTGKPFFFVCLYTGHSCTELTVRRSYRALFDEDGELILTHRDLLLEFDRALKEVKEEMKARGRPDDFIGARVMSNYMFFPGGSPL